MSVQNKNKNNNKRSFGNILILKVAIRPNVERPMQRKDFSSVGKFREKVWKFKSINRFRSGVS